MERLDEETSSLRTEIERNELATIERYQGEKANIKRFINIIGLYNGWNPHQDAVMFAIHNKSYDCAEAILEILKKTKQEKREIKKTLNGLYKTIAQLTTGENAGGDTPIVYATKNGQHIFAKILLESLKRKQRYDVIKQKEGCKGDCSGNTHGEGCKAGYNLLMLALETSPDDGLLPSFIVDFVCKHQDLEYKTEIAIGKEEPEIYGQTPNSIRLAAATGKRELGIKLLRESLRSDHCYRAFLEVGPPKDPEVSAMASVLELDGIESLERLWRANKSEALHETLVQSPGMYNNFLHQKMRQDAIKHFSEVRALKYNYLIPKPSELSGPMALIFQNSFQGTEHYLEDSKKEAKCLEDALQSLGWGEAAIKIISKWTFNELIEKLTKSIKKERYRCSLLLLYITSHGFADHIVGIPKRKKTGDQQRKSFSFGQVSKIIDAITLLPEFIPKVLILDVCRVQLDPLKSINAKIKTNNILILNATLLGDEAAQYLYVPELAKQIEELAECNVSLQEIQMILAPNIKHMPLEDSESTMQVPHMETTAHKIVLRRYDGNEHNCMIADCKMDIKRSYRECLICNKCLRWYHPSCAGYSEDDLNLFRKSTYKPLQCLKCDKLGKELRT